MARHKSGKSQSSIFREYFQRHPELLDSPSNEKIYEMFAKDHPDMPLTEAIKGVCANVKSSEKKKRKTRTAGGGGTWTAAGVNRATAVAATMSPLEALEESIDACLSMAKQDRDGLADVIRHLRRARNLVSFKLENQ